MSELQPKQPRKLKKQFKQNPIYAYDPEHSGLCAEEFYAKSSLVDGWKLFFSQMIKDALMAPERTAVSSEKLAKDEAIAFFKASSNSEMGKYRDYLLENALGYNNPSKYVSKMRTLIDSGITIDYFRNEFGIR